jgi:RNA polymerase sigma-70 factor, ECF subfamily
MVSVVGPDRRLEKVAIHFSRLSGLSGRLVPMSQMAAVPAASRTVVVFSTVGGAGPSTNETMINVVDKEDEPKAAPFAAASPLDPEILRQLVEEHSEAVYRVAKSVIRDAALAEDVAQETLIKAWQAIRTFRSESTLRSWILRIAHNNAVSTLRKRRDIVRDPIDMPEQPGGVSVEARAEDRAALQSFEAALGELDELSRSIVVLRKPEHLSYDDIAETLGVPLPTVKTRLLCARRVLANALGEWRP